ncbi:MAG: thioesterase family protein [Firmicutes bacterium]|nr:thioesterase family protein [Bacillota bacterium]
MAYFRGERGILLLQNYVGPDYMDMMGHMNVQHYSRLFDAATWTLFTLVGIDYSYINEKQCGMASVEQSFQYFKEVAPGTTVQIWTRFRPINAKMLQIRHQMVMPQLESDMLLAQLEQKAVHFDLTGRKSRPFPETVSETMQLLCRQGFQLE